MPSNLVRIAQRNACLITVLMAVAAVSVFTAACGSSDTAQNGSTESIAPAATIDSVEDVLPTSTPAPQPTDTPAPEPTPEEPDPTPEPTKDPNFELLFSDDEEKALVARLTTLWGWDTNFAHRAIPLTELRIVLGRDKIPPIDSPNFLPVAEAPAYMDPREPVVALVIDGDARAYPLAMLMWHEIVNDTVGGEPVTVTFCPLCNTGITFSRIVEGEELTFGTSGMLRNSDLVMWDRQSESLWQQITGEALAGDYANEEAVLEQVPSSIIAWETFAETYPDGLLLERELNEFGIDARPYDNPPYAGYDNIDAQPFLFNGAVDGRLVATSRVLTIDGETSVAYPFAFLEENPVVNDTVNSQKTVAFFDNGTYSPFNNLANAKQTVGSVSVYSRQVGDQLLTFGIADEAITDNETGSTWNLAGVATSGELAGTKLEPVIHANHFWFAWAVFKPDTEIRDSLDDLSG